MVKPTEKSLMMLRKISETVKTWHHHQHVLYDIAETFPPDMPLVYVEIGCFAGASSCLMIQRPNTRVIAIDNDAFSLQPQVEENVKRHNTHGNLFNYIKEDSHSLLAINMIRKMTDTIHILFIDGGHQYSDVFLDFSCYARFVAIGGYVVFDDYNDPEFKGVHDAVDDIVSKLSNNWEVIGTFDNVLGARGFPEGEIRGNCFVLRRV